ncbi:MAG: hypothetical protein CMI09_08690 [Oceanospirillaceae bacterium]|nr:hypothetical protein [Oceanospirillaceae bacterium]
MRYTSLNPQKALIWRIVHCDNLPWILANGLFAGNHPHKAARWVSIGNAELIEKRSHHPVPIHPGGMLNDYVPFYFTPFSPMLLNIHTGRAGVPRHANEDIVILVSSIHTLHQQQVPVIFTDGHAYYQWTTYFSDPADLNRIDWPLLQARDFSRDPDDPGKFERYQAEALVHQHCPVSSLLGLVCYNDQMKLQLEKQLQQAGVKLPVEVRPRWYFS